MPAKFEKKVKSRGGASRYRNVKIKGREDEYLKCAVVKGKGKKGGKTVCYKKSKKGK